MEYSIDPTTEQFKSFKDLPRDQPIHMLNLICLNDVATYAQSNQFTGLQAYQTYAKESGPIFKRVGGKILWRGHPETLVIGPPQEQWHIAFIATYPDGNAFLAMVTDPAYQAIVFHRQAAVKDSRLIRLGALEANDLFG